LKGLKISIPKMAFLGYLQVPPKRFSQLFQFSGFSQQDSKQLAEIR